MKPASDKIWTVSSGTRQTSHKVQAANSYFIEIKPLLVLLRLFGRFPYSFGENGIQKFRIISLPFIYSATFFIFQTAWTSYSLSQLFYTKIAHAKSYDLILYWISLGIFNLHNFIVPFTNWLEASKVVRYIGLWQSFQDEFGCGELKLSLRVHILVSSVLLLPLVAGLILFEIFLLMDGSLLFFWPYFTSIGNCALFIIVWVTTLHEITLMSRRLLQKIIKEGCSIMSENRFMWLKLSALASSLGDTLGETGLTYLVLLFATFVPTSYGLLAFFFDHSGTSNSFWGLLITAIFTMTAKFIICDLAHRTTYEVGEKFSERILQQDLSKLPQSEMNETILFLQTMAANPPIIQFHGFVTVNRGLYVSFVSNTVTYLVVLLQFKASSMAMSSTPSNATTPVGNH